MRLSVPLLSLLLLGLDAHPAVAIDEVPQLQVTRTWGDLLATPPIILQGIPTGGSLLQATSVPPPATFHIHVGIDRDHVSANGTVLLYCLTDGIGFGNQSQQSLGPFQVVVRQPGTDSARNLLARANDRFGIPGARYGFYALPLLIPDHEDFFPHPPVDCIIELQAPPKANVPPHVFASIKIQVSGRTLLSWPWLPWGQSDQALAPAVGPGSGTVSATVSNPMSRSSVFPKGPPAGFYLAKLPATDKPLPQLNLEKPDPAIQLKMDDGILVVTLADPVPGTDPVNRFLTRWWVNDQPFDAGKMAEKALEEKAASPSSTREVDFKLDFHPEPLHAKKGDKIGVQLLFCPYGWEYTDMNMAEDLAEAYRLGTTPANLSSPSPRIDFIYSGDPAHPQQK